MSQNILHLIRFQPSNKMEPCFARRPFENAVGQLWPRLSLHWLHPFFLLMNHSHLHHMPISSFQILIYPSWCMLTSLSQHSPEPSFSDFPIGADLNPFCKMTAVCPMGSLHDHLPSLCSPWSVSLLGSGFLLALARGWWWEVRLLMVGRAIFYFESCWE